jgi:hypothetical protein
VINWFQHRRQREPVKEKGGYVRNNTLSPEDADASIDLPDLSSTVPSFHEFFTQTEDNMELSPIEGDIFAFRIYLTGSNLAVNEQQETLRQAHQ